MSWYCLRLAQAPSSAGLLSMASECRGKKTLCYISFNAVVARLLANDLSTVPGKPSVLLNNGHAGNAAPVEDPRTSAY